MSRTIPSGDAQLARRADESLISEQTVAGRSPVDEQPSVLFIDDIAREFGMSVRTIQRRLRLKVFPIPEMPSLDQRHRWSRAAVEAFKASCKQQAGNSQTVTRDLRVVRSAGKR